MPRHDSKYKSGSGSYSESSDDKPRFNKCGNILISDNYNNRIIECDPKEGTIVWQYGLGPTNFTRHSIIGPNDSQRVGTYTLMVGTGIPPDTISDASGGIVDNRILLVNRHKEIVWQYGHFGKTGSSCDLLNVPTQATYIPGKNKKDIFDGSVLICDQGNARIIQVLIKCKKIIFEYPGNNTNPNEQLSSPNSAEYLCNGNYLISDESNNRALEVTRHDRVVKIFTATNTLGACAFASRLPNGNTLLTDSTNSKVVEVNCDDVPVWQYITNADPLSIPNPSPSRAIRLKNGDTIISNQFNNQVIIVRDNVIVQSYGLPLVGGSGPIGANHGYSRKSTQFGLYAPYDAKVVGDYTGITSPK